MLDRKMKFLCHIDPWKCKYTSWNMKVKDEDHSWYFYNTNFNWACVSFLSSSLVKHITPPFFVHLSHGMTHAFVELIFFLFTQSLFDLIEPCLSIDDQVILVILKIIFKEGLNLSPNVSALYLFSHILSFSNFNPFIQCPCLSQILRSDWKFR